MLQNVEKSVIFRQLLIFQQLLQSQVRYAHPAPIHRRATPTFRPALLHKGGQGEEEKLMRNAAAAPRQRRLLGRGGHVGTGPASQASAQ